MDYPLDQIAFEKKFATDEECRAYLMAARWPDGFKCPRCGTTSHWRMVRGLVLCGGCRYQCSVTAGTIFHRSKLPLTVIFRALWWIVAQKNGVSALGLQRILGIGSFDTAWTWLHKFRRLMVVPGREKLSGVVEVDETFVGGHKAGKRGRGAQGKVLVAIAVEVRGEATGRVRLAILKNASEKSLKHFVTANVATESSLITDGWSGYANARDWGYQHAIETKKMLLDGEEALPNVHRVAALLKRWLLGTHQGYVGNEQLVYYLDEFVFRHNRRRASSRGLLFQTLIKQGVRSEPVPYSKIVANPRPRRVRSG